jgi:hypothetical protein
MPNIKFETSLIDRLVDGKMYRDSLTIEIPSEKITDLKTLKDLLSQKIKEHGVHAHIKEITLNNTTKVEHVYHIEKAPAASNFKVEVIPLSNQDIVELGHLKELKGKIKSNLELISEKSEKLSQLLAEVDAVKKSIENLTDSTQQMRTIMLNKASKLQHILLTSTTRPQMPTPTTSASVQNGTMFAKSAHVAAEASKTVRTTMQSTANQETAEIKPVPMPAPIMRMVKS